MELNLQIVKQSLNIDYSDNDAYLQLLLDANIKKAEEITGIDCLDFNSEIKLAILEDVAFDFENRGSENANNNTIAVYRRYSKRAML